MSLLEQALAARAQLLGGLGFGWPRQRFWVAEWEFEEIERGTRGVEGVWDRMVGGGGGGRGVEGGLEVEIVEGENHVSLIMCFFYGFSFLVFCVLGYRDEFEITWE